MSKKLEISVSKNSGTFKSMGLLSLQGRFVLMLCFRFQTQIPKNGIMNEVLQDGAAIAQSWSRRNETKYLFYYLITTLCGESTPEVDP